MIYSRTLEVNLGTAFVLPVELLTAFKSRKNKVFLIRYGTKLAICKLFRSVKLAYKEWFLLFRLRSLGISAPLPYTLSGNCSIREFIDGLPLVELLETRQPQMWIEPLVDWLYAFHYHVNLKLGDVNLRNFIFRENESTIYAIDFEDATFGNPLDDIGDLVVHILTHRPQFTAQKYRIAAQVLRGYMELAGISRDEAVEAVYQGFLRAAVRRRNPHLLNCFQFVQKIDSLLEFSI